MTSTIAQTNPEIEKIKKDLFKMAMRGQWEDVVKIYSENKTFHKAKLTSSGDTALHIAVSDGREEEVRKLVGCITAQPDGKDVLNIRNDQGSTPLHIAASIGNVAMCECIAKVEPSLVGARNDDNETPFFLAALYGKKDAFLRLHQICGTGSGYKYSRRKDGDTILHCAIAGDYFDLAFRIIHLYEKLVNSFNEKGWTPLHLLASKPSAFKSGSHLGGWYKMIYYCIFVDDLPSTGPESYLDDQKKQDYPENYRTCLDFLQFFQKGDFFFFFFFCLDFFFFFFLFFCHRNHLSHPGFNVTNGVLGHQLFPANYGTCFEFVKFASKAMLVIFGLEDHEQPQVDKETPILSAAKNGIIEMVERILRRFPMAINDETSEGKNIVMLAAEYRQTQVYELFRKSHLRIESMFHKLDNDGNSALHLAAKQTEQKTGLIPGAAWQMQWEIKCQKVFVRRATINLNSISKQHKTQEEEKSFLLLPNKNGKTPGDIFMDTHKPLVEEGGKWLSDTSNACSIVAGLFVTVAFNMSTTIPGEVDDKGNPRLEKQLAFNIFAISSYISFYSSLLAMIMFLAILTSGYKESSFRSTLPMKLLLALTAFYMSIASTAISFSAAHLFILRENLKSATFPTYLGAVLLLICFAISGFPLYFHLIWAIFKTVPHHQHMLTPAGFHIKH
ncbi:hypothetical protein ACJW30_10G176100 [Castanea mollissima]